MALTWEGPGLDEVQARYGGWICRDDGGGKCSARRIGDGHTVTALSPPQLATALLILGREARQRARPVTN